MDSFHSQYHNACKEEENTRQNTKKLWEQDKLHAKADKLAYLNTKSSLKVHIKFVQQEILKPDLILSAIVY